LVPLARLQVLLTVFALFLGSGALAQTPPANNEPQPFFYPAPPAGFAPVSASDDDLATYGFPRRPSQADASYGTWAKFVANAKQRLANPVAEKTGIVYGLGRRGPKPVGTGVANTTEADYQWSGVAVTYPYALFSAYGNVTASSIEPNIGYENCSYGSYYAAIWAGLDGWRDALGGNNDVLQAGFTAGACPTRYYAWYEWYTIGCTVDTAAYPCNAWAVNLPVNPGDYIYSSVTYNGGLGVAFLENYSTGLYVSVSFHQPPGGAGSAYQGYSAEWILERPGTQLMGFHPSDLANYYVPYSQGNSVPLAPGYYNPATYHNLGPGDDPASTLYTINMVCNGTANSASWNPSGNCPAINGFSQYITLTDYWAYNQQPPPGYLSGTVYFFVYGPAASQ
jgi:Peptidase A4 family